MTTIRAFGFASLLASAAAVAQEPPPSPVAVSRVVDTEITQTVPVTGSVFSRNDIQITIGVDGQLERVAEPGTRVKQGDEIARIDTVPLELQKAEQAAQAERAQAQLTFLNAQLGRQQNLIDSNSTSRNQLEQTRSDRDVAASDLRIAELRMRQIDDQLARATIRAQFDGVVIARMRREGEDVSRGDVIARVTDTQNLEVRVFAPLQYAGRVNAGDTLRIFGHETEHEGAVRTVVPAADMRSQTFELRIDLPPDALATRSIGQLVSVAVPMRSAVATLAVPRDALILRQDGTYVFRIADDLKAQRVRVQTGDSAGDLVAVRGDLSAGDRVVIRGAETLADGRTVAILDSTNGTGTAASPSAN